MKLNWVHGIAALYTSFAVMILTFVVIYTQWDLHLVTENYYEEEISYQQMIDKKSNSQMLSGDVHFRWDAATEKVTIDFPDEIADAAGKVQVYRPSDSGLDVLKEVATNNGEAVVAPGALKPGLWRVNLEWQAAGVNYFNEGVLIVN